ncbi:fatty-acyl coenzyme A oxidase [Marasmius sp. AFHP31]|nr:fatty-acyl coenzyme A oxidase [Marasmius sp. AFHP31]
MIHPLFVFLALGLAGQAYASDGPVSTDINIVNAEISPDGFSRVGVLANGTFPGPTLSGQKGDHFKIMVNNELQDKSMVTSTSVHWHGLKQHGSSWADGVASVTQCPISPGHSFEYQFHATDQAGTHWYHSHLSTQYCDGLRGPFIVYDPNDPHQLLYDVDDESTIITLADCVPDSTLINGLGRYKGGPASALAVINVEFGKRYRFRLISMSCDPNYVFSIDDHPLTVIEADGVNTLPLPVDSIQIYAGQRYSFILNAIGTSGNYWIRSNPNMGAMGFEDGINLAILRYKDAPELDPTTESHEYVNPLKEQNLHPFENPGAPGEPHEDGADIHLNMALGFDTTTKKFTLNGNSFVPPSVPVLLQILSGAAPAESLLPSGSVYSLPPNKTIQISMPAGKSAGSPHPMHLHGHVFDVVRSAGSSEFNFVDPVRRDVVNTGVDGDNVTIRFKTDNAGPWFLHCHIDRHIDGGMAVVFAEDVPGVANAKADVPESWDQLCPIHDALEESSEGAGQQRKRAAHAHRHAKRFDSSRDLF